MRGFRFRMETILALRKQREELLQRQLADSQRALAAEEQRLQLIDEALKSQTKSFAELQMPGPLDMGRIRLESVRLAALESELSAQAGRVEREQKRVAEDREALLQASREKKALEKLRETLMLSFLHETARKEQKSLEEAATVRHVLRQMDRVSSLPLSLSHEIEIRGRDRRDG